ncbi:MAG: TIGR01777 family oxidoreductase [Actinomycetota bacterium]
MKLVIAGGTGALGQRVADDFSKHDDEVVILTRSPRPDIAHRQVVWDGRTAGDWVHELEGVMLLNLAGELVDRRPTAKNIEGLRRSRVEPTRALAEAAPRLEHPPAVWLQMSTLAIYGDAGEETIDEQHAPAEGPPQMPGVARPWEAAVEGAKAGRLVVLRTGIVLDTDTPAFDRLTRLTRLGLGGRIATGQPWISWIHIDDYLRALRFVIDRSTLGGIVHVTSPNPIRNRDMMAALRSALHRPWSPPTPEPLVRLGALLMRTDPELALTGRRCVPRRLIDEGFEFEHPNFADAIASLFDRRRSR